MLIFIALEQRFSEYKKAPEGASAGYANPAARYFVPGLKILLITCPIRYQLWLQQHLNVLQ